MKKKYFELTRPMILLFIILNGILLVFRHRMADLKINIDVVVSANLFLFVVSMTNIYFQMTNLNNPNANAVIRGVMAGTFLKLLVLAAAAMIYLFASGTNRSVNAVFAGMVLYIIYTWLEVRITLKMNPKK
jgi:hypothetical protein